MKGGYGLRGRGLGALCVQVNVVLDTLRWPEPNHTPGLQLLFTNQFFQHILGIIVDFFGLFTYEENVVKNSLKDANHQRRMPPLKPLPSSVIFSSPLSRFFPSKYFPCLSSHDVGWGSEGVSVVPTVYFPSSSHFNFPI